MPGTSKVFIVRATRASKLAGRTDAAAGGVSGAGIRPGGRTEADGVRGFAAIWGLGGGGGGWQGAEGTVPEVGLSLWGY